MQKIFSVKRFIGALLATIFLAGCVSGTPQLLLGEGTRPSQAFGAAEVAVVNAANNGCRPISVGASGGLAEGMMLHAVYILVKCTTGVQLAPNGGLASSP